MNLPPIRPPSSCGVYSTPGYPGFPEAFDHHHDSRYYSKTETDCAVRAPSAIIYGTPPPSICTGCEALAGYVISNKVNSSDVVTLQIQSWTDPGSGPYAIPAVDLPITVTGNDVLVTWGPDNNEASISLLAIATAIAADPVASDLLRVAVCDEDQFVAFNQGLPIQPVSYPSHFHLSADITDASYGGEGVADEDKLLRFGGNGEIAASNMAMVYSLTGQKATALVAGPTFNECLLQFVDLTNLRKGMLKCPNLTIADVNWNLVNRSGSIPALSPFASDSAAAAGGVLGGDVWWDTSLLKARTRPPTASNGASPAPAGAIGELIGGVGNDVWGPLLIHDLTFVDLGPGDWDVWATLRLTPDITVGPLTVIASISDVANVNNGIPNHYWDPDGDKLGSITLSTIPFRSPVGARLYLSAYVQYDHDQLQVAGEIYARRVR